MIFCGPDAPSRLAGIDPAYHRRTLCSYLGPIVSGLGAAPFSVRSSDLSHSPTPQEGAVQSLVPTRRDGSLYEIASRKTT